ncbi:MAG TPA: PDDEXK nuclease domain-containing protein [Verrucomicrobiales bacterium]|nr:PDDEXK nuclease domain-containing protein [Verrucomicrobiales bacterium]
MKRALIPADYASFLAGVKVSIRSARLHAGRAVNRQLVQLYWDLGSGIVGKQRTSGWGDAVVERMAADLRAEFPDMQGFSAANIWRMRQFFETYTTPEFLAQLARELRPRKPSSKTPDFLAQAARELVSALPWGHHLELMAKVKTPEALLYYLRASAQCGWSRSLLLNQIKAGNYERAVLEKKTHNFAVALPEHFAEQADEMLKSRYNLEFLGIAEPMRERELENRLIERLQQFILELGYGFCFVGRQYRLALGRKEYFVDLLFYHRFLKALVAFDLKIGTFQPEHAGKMDFYLNLLNDKERSPEDRPSIGVILCAEKDDVEVEFALKTKGNPISVAEYRLQGQLPAELKGKLPTAKQLADVVREAVPAPKAASKRSREA